MKKLLSIVSLLAVAAAMGVFSATALAEDPPPGDTTTTTTTTSTTTTTTTTDDPVTEDACESMRVLGVVVSSSDSAVVVKVLKSSAPELSAGSEVSFAVAAKAKVKLAGKGKHRRPLTFVGKVASISGRACPSASGKVYMAKTIVVQLQRAEDGHPGKKRGVKTDDTVAAEVEKAESPGKGRGKNK